jgi:hypothetical protein
MLWANKKTLTGQTWEDLPPVCDRIMRISRDDWSRRRNTTYLGCSAGLGWSGLSPAVDDCCVEVVVLVEVVGVLVDVVGVLVDVAGVAADVFVVGVVVVLAR